MRQNDEKRDGGPECSPGNVRSSLGPPTYFDINSDQAPWTMARRLYRDELTAGERLLSDTPSPIPRLLQPAVHTLAYHLERSSLTDTTVENNPSPKFHLTNTDRKYQTRVIHAPSDQLTVSVDLFQHRPKLLGPGELSQAAHHPAELLLRYTPVAVLVEEVERFFELCTTNNKKKRE